MIDFSPTQKRTIAAGVTVLSFTIVLAFVVFIGWVLAFVLNYVSAALVPVIEGLFLAMLFRPCYGWFVRRCKNHQHLALAAMLLSILVPLVILCWWGGAFLIDQFIHLIKAAPMVVERLSAWLNSQIPQAQTFLTQMGAKPDDLLMLFMADPAKFSQELISTLGSAYGADAVKAGFSILKYVMSLASSLVTILFFVYFLTRPVMTGMDCARQMPILKAETQAFVAKQLDLFFDILVNFFQRQVVICVIEGVFYGLGFACVGLPYGFIIGFILGALNLVPLLGTVTCLPLALPIAYFGEDGCLWRLVAVLVVWLMGQFLDGYCITPKIQGEKTGLGYAGVIFSFFFWGIVFNSLVGLLLAIPLSAFCVVLWRALRETYIKGVI